MAWLVLRNRDSAGRDGGGRGGADNGVDGNHPLGREAARRSELASEHRCGSEAGPAEEPWGPERSGGSNGHPQRRQGRRHRAPQRASASEDRRGSGEPVGPRRMRGPTRRRRTGRQQPGQGLGVEGGRSPPGRCMRRYRLTGWLRGGLSSTG
jgi:hypothetical protein